MLDAPQLRLCGFSLTGSRLGRVVGGIGDPAPKHRCCVDISGVEEHHYRRGVLCPLPLPAPLGREQPRRQGSLLPCTNCCDRLSIPYPPVWRDFICASEHLRRMGHGPLRTTAWAWCVCADPCPRRALPSIFVHGFHLIKNAEQAIGVTPDQHSHMALHSALHHPNTTADGRGRGLFFNSPNPRTVEISRNRASTLRLSFGRLGKLE